MDDDPSVINPDTIVWLAAQLPLGQLPSGRFWFDRKLAALGLSLG